MNARSHCFGVFLLASLIFATTQPADAAPVAALVDPPPALNLGRARHAADGSFEFRVEWAWAPKILIESSTDLVNWTSEGLRAPNTLVQFTNTHGGSAQQFYRARDYLLRLSGTVRHVETDVPIARAKVTIVSLYPWLQEDIVTETDARGVFHLAAPGDPPSRHLRIEKEGYDRLAIERTIYPDDSDLQMALWLAPAGYRPPNDDFQNRLALEGTNVAVHARTFAATPEPGDPIYVTYDDYSAGFPRNIWWAWTAPTNGAVLIERQPASADSGVVVFTGQSLSELVRVWDTTNPENAFFVSAGVQYQIGFGTYLPADTGFTLRMVPSVAPFAVRAWPGSEGHAGASHSSTTLRVGETLMFGAAAQGTAPLNYQWHKDGGAIPGATNASWVVTHDVEFDDAGAYSVVVSNRSGTASSEPIQISVVQERSHLPEIMRGSWTMGSYEERQIVTFTGDEFTVLESDGSFAGSGRYELIGTWQSHGYHLVMTYTAPAPVVHDYTLSIFDNSGSYEGSIIQPDGSRTAVSGHFWRLEEP